MKNLFLLIYLFFITSFLTSSDMKIIYENERIFLNKLSEYSTSELPLNNYKKINNEGKEIYIFLENNIYILYLTKDFNLIVKNKNTNENAKVLCNTQHTYSEVKPYIKFYLDEDKMIDINYGGLPFDGELWNDTYYIDDILTAGCKIIPKNENSISILYFYYFYLGSDGDCKYITKENFHKIKNEEKNRLWFYSADKSGLLKEHEKIIETVGKPFYIYSSDSTGINEIKRKEILKENDIGVNEIRQNYRNLGLDEYLQQKSIGGIIIPITYILTVEGLEQFISEDDIFFSDNNNFNNPKAEYYYPIEKPEFIGELVIKEK